MSTLTAAQVFKLAKDAGLSPATATIATAIAKAESGWRTDAVGDVSLQDSKWGPSVGLWQVRSVKAEYGTGSTRDASRLTDPAFNARSMVAISGAGANWRPWSVYTSGAYKKYLSASAPDITTSDGNPFLPPGAGKGLAGIGEAAGAGASVVAGAVGAIAGGWGDTAVKLLATGVAGALIVVGAIRTVSGGSS